MATTRKELKEQARDQLRGNWGWAVLLSFVGWLIVYILTDIENFFEKGEDIVYGIVRCFGNNAELMYLDKVRVNPFAWLITLVVSVAIGLITWGVIYTILHFRDSGTKENVLSGIFSPFTRNFKSNFLTYILYEIFLILWTWLLIIPGLIKAYSYAMTPYILRDMLDSGHEPTATEAISASRKLMDGHKMDLFIFDLSFIGWWLLGIISCGIGLLWVNPYYRQAKANFYRNLAGEQFAK